MTTPDAPPDIRYRQFVADTLARRIPVIIRNAGEGFDAETVARLNSILRVVELDAPMVVDLSDWPFAGWERLPARVNGKHVTRAPFFDFEYWLYFRILTAVRFAETRSDPFRLTKHRDLDRHLKWADEALGRTHTIGEGLRLSLGANAHDLSQVSTPTSTYELGLEQLDTAGAGVTRLNLIADNFGGEFVADLVLGIVAAEAGVEVVFHVKQLPIFVSDTTLDDVTIILDRVANHSAFGDRLTKAVAGKSIRFAAHPFWSAPEFFDRLPLDELGQGPGVLNVLKGDLNFRRALGDASVDISTPLEQLPVLPAAPMLSLRSIKSYCVAGMGMWPTALSKTDFPMDGAIVAVQHIPARPSGELPAPPPVVPPARRTLLDRFRRLTPRRP